MNRYFLAAALGAQVVGVATSAHAFCRTTTCDPNKESCEKQGACIVSGLPLSWSGRCLLFGVDHDGSPRRGIDYETALSVISNAYLAWQNVDCGGGQGPSLSMRVSEPITCDSQKYNKYIGNANTWIFQDDDWPYDRVANHLALTTLTFKPETGEIFDVDVEINTADNPISFGDTGVSNDLLSIVTHEAGHFFGLSHTTVAGSTMLADYRTGSTIMRSLGPDDSAGICEVYPPERLTSPCKNSVIPRRGFLAECGVDEPPESGCCTTAPGTGGRAPSSAILAGGLGLLLIALRRRRASRAR